MCWLRLQSHRFFCSHLWSTELIVLPCTGTHSFASLTRSCFSVSMCTLYIHPIQMNKRTRNWKKNNNKILLATSRSIMFAFFCAIQYYLQATSTQHCYCFSCCRFHIAFFTIRAYVFYYYVVACHFFSNCHGYCCCVVESSAWWFSQFFSIKCTYTKCMGHLLLLFLRSFLYI